MRTASSRLAVLAWLAASQLVSAVPAHGDGDEGSIMGPVAFLWPEDRAWDAADDNIGPCGSSSGVTNRTIFPLSKSLSGKPPKPWAAQGWNC